MTTRPRTDTLSHKSVVNSAHRLYWTRSERRWIYGPRLSERIAPSLTHSPPHTPTALFVEGAASSAQPVASNGPRSPWAPPSSKPSWLIALIRCLWHLAPLCRAAQWGHFCQTPRRYRFDREIRSDTLEFVAPNLTSQQLTRQIFPNKYSLIK